MKTKFLHIVRTKPVFLFLLPLFFVLHGLVQYSNLIPFKDALFLLLVYSGISLVIAFLYWFLFRNLIKAALAAFVIMSCNFFFWTAFYFLKEHFNFLVFLKLRFIFPALLLAIILINFYLKKSKKPFFKITRYLNVLLLLLILIDTGTLLFKLIKNKSQKVQDLSKELRQCDSCARPDIYFIIADEYAGKTALSELFSFDNSGFENELQIRGFHIINHSASNYNATVYSMASLLNMDYLENLTSPEKINHTDMLICRRLINNSNLTRFLLQNGYKIYNFSFFDFANKKRRFNNFFFPSGKSLLTSQTFVNRFIFHFGARIASPQKINDFKKNNRYNDIKIEELTRKTVLTGEDQPKFIYSHFTMPHHPYFYDSKGIEIPVDSLTDEFRLNRKAYIEYLQYSNNKILDLVDFIKNKSAKPPVIILLGDHGFRQLTNDVDKKYWFMNLNAVYIPGRNYTGFYDGMTNVNQFRVIFNSVFGKHLPILKDSTSFLWEY